MRGSDFFQNQLYAGGTGGTIVKHAGFGMEFCDPGSGCCVIKAADGLHKGIIVLNDVIGKLLEAKVVTPVVSVGLNVRRIEEARSAGERKIDGAGGIVRDQDTRWH